MKPCDLLLVEDNPGDADLIRQALTQASGTDFSIRHAATLVEGVEALALAKADLVLLDLGLPDADGLDGLEVLRKSAPEVPVIVLTGIDDERWAVEALQKGAQDYIIKGALDGRLLSRTIRYAIERSQILQELDAATRELRSANARLEQLTLIDPLTELLNRRGFQIALSREQQLQKREQSPMAALLVDLDAFKTVNDTWGHAVGDQVLTIAAQALTGCLRATDPIARIGGDEFLVLLPQTRPAEGVRVAEKVRLALREACRSLSSGAVSATASVGVAMVSPEVRSIDELLALLHVGLHHSKENGKDRVSYVPAGPGGEELEHRVISGVLEVLREGKRFRAVQQPVYRLSDEQAVGMEFLVRCEVQGFEMPEEFFRLCLGTDLLSVVDRECLKTCIAASSGLPDTVRRHFNLFPSVLLEVHAPRLLEMFPKDPAETAYCLELSEHQLIGDSSSLVKPVRALRDAGFLIALDKVGFGRSSLESLILLEPDLVKLDRRWIQGVAKDPARAHSLERLLRIAQGIGSEVVAVGIESVDDKNALRDLGVLYGQGFLWGRPK